MITVLSGGGGGAKFVDGLSKLTQDFSVIANTGDDIEFYGLHISPDLDTIMYTISGQLDLKKGWGIKNDTFACQKYLKSLGYEDWIGLGDKDLAVHIKRTDLLNSGKTLTEATTELCKKFGVDIPLIPMTNDFFQTHIELDSKIIHFEEYYIKKPEGKIKNIIYKGKEKAKPSEEFLNALDISDYVIIPPSNPLVSIGTILSLKGIRKRLREKTVIGISPLIQGRAVKGPLVELMRSSKYEVNSLGVAKYYEDLLDIFIIDNLESDTAERIRGELGMEILTTNTLMESRKDRIRLSKFVLTRMIK
ncbi:MAG: 2-phospho-L-lactate transferase [Candidatus Methanofastidiosum methylothiophilum]|uniref:2-phospho-L-lactate transferase n=1 Tax=Candidatus Methanofastidiosum methylothiophilum TaxID=1705564 RepID=A0A150IJ56_9EURY|nr:MAG: 2-phospho-L-lactate transferase [Candidatus Methanofastidiosum methylthiophilus]KYC46999.1 MAG: 2-phospho-L-lactate transferase [Candidatus Methanofastidiosum methylthiophilus]KYC49384.1 MAG: 2-phospho-L-lactate transferase [Candidatus Methanofastidiosum methylthiophilus]